jgi:hypothetical protein
VAVAWFERDPGGYLRIKVLDDEMATLHTKLMAELASGQTSLPVAMFGPGCSLLLAAR